MWRGVWAPHMKMPYEYSRIYWYFWLGFWKIRRELYVYTEFYGICWTLVSIIGMANDPSKDMYLTGQIHHLSLFKVKCLEAISEFQFLLLTRVNLTVYQCFSVYHKLLIVAFLRMEVKFSSVMFTQTQNYAKKRKMMKCFGVNVLSNDRCNVRDAKSWVSYNHQYT